MFEAVERGAKDTSLGVTLRRAQIPALLLRGCRVLLNLWTCLLNHKMGQTRSFHKIIVETDDTITDTCPGCRALTKCPLLHFPFYSQSASLSCECPCPSFLFYSWSQQGPDPSKVQTPHQPLGFSLSSLQWHICTCCICIEIIRMRLSPATYQP